MSENDPDVVVVTFDAAAGSFSVNPDPVALAPGTTVLYFALQTANRGHASAAVFAAIYEDDLITAAAPVDGSGQLWRVEIVNDPPPPAAESHAYTVRVGYAGKELSHDPTVILEPPPIGY